MLSIHFYDIDDVCRALLLALRHGRAKEAVFWARELVLSHEEDSLGKTMIKAWLLLLGAPCIQWLDAWTTVKGDVGGCQRLVLVAEFSRLVSGYEGRAPYQCFVLAARGFAPVADLEKVGAALGEGDPFRLYWHLGPMKPVLLAEQLCTYVDSPELFDSIKVAIKASVIPMSVLLGAAAVQLLCMSEYPATLVLTCEADVASWLCEWEPTVGRRSGRLYELESSVSESELLCSAIDLMKKGCAYWQGALVLVQDDSSHENVVDLHFPDDIPDEWSRSDRAKSHPVHVVGPSREDKLKNIWSFTPFLMKPWSAKFKQYLLQLV